MLLNICCILIRSDGQFEVELSLCPPICPNLPYTEIYVTLPIEDGTEPCMFDAIISESQCSHYADLNVSFSFNATSASIFQHKLSRRRRRRRRRAPRRNFTLLRAENVQDEILRCVPTWCPSRHSRDRNVGACHLRNDCVLCVMIA